MYSSSLVSAVSKFSAKFCNELSKEKSVVSSPLSAEVLLALLTLGTTDPAHSELLKSLDIASDDEIRSSFATLSSNLKSVKGVTLDIANRVYIKEGDYDLAPEIKNDAVRVFDAGLEKMNFAESTQSANTINKWVEDKTNNRIKDLISPDCLNDDTRLVLVNAIYFKGTWQKQFDPKHTMNQPFHVNVNKTVEVAMMFKEDNYRYGESSELDCQLLEMPYVGGQAKMLVLLPREIEGLNGLLSKLASGYDLLSELKKMHSLKVQVSLPKFKIETEIDLNVLLPKLGIKAIFGPGNTGLTRLLNCDEPLVVSKAVQKAFIEVNEEGAEAAAATAAVVMLRCAFPMTPPFRADRPFLYALMDHQETVLFIGAYRGDN